MESERTHGQMAKWMARRHYMMFGLNMVVSLVVMYFMMFTMIWSLDHLFNSSNMFYMAVMMVTPMGVLMPLMMGMMYPNRKSNLLLYALFALLFILALWSMRAQALVGDRQFVRAMIPHHAGAILM